MCIFCAAIPAALAVGANANAQQRRQAREAEAGGQEARRPKIPAGPATAVLVTGLVAASVVYHTQLSG